MGSKDMTQPIADFFEELVMPPGARSRVVAGKTVRFDIRLEGGGVEHWFVELETETVRTSRENRAADCEVTCDADFFTRLLTSGTNVLASWLRNEIAVAGDPRIVVMFRKLLPGTPDATDPGPTTKRGQP
jgi:SCP-2 sterol transfer family